MRRFIYINSVKKNRNWALGPNRLGLIKQSKWQVIYRQDIIFWIKISILGHQPQEFVFVSFFGSQESEFSYLISMVCLYFHLCFAIDLIRPSTYILSPLEGISKVQLLYCVTNYATL
jgi:hypothetical protein